jgi:ADP-ribose pyrophosphatase
VEKPDFVMIVPLNVDGLHVVQQFRYPIGALPQGSWGEGPDADPPELSRGEVWEEAGLRAAKMIEVGHLFKSCGYARQAVTFFSPPT